jgi:hypothetical protein
MPINSQYTKVLIGAYDLSGSNNGCDVAMTNGALDTTAFQDGGKTWIVDNAEGVISHAGYFDTGTGTQEHQLYTALTTATTIGAVYDTAGTAPVAYVLPSAKNRNMTIGASVGSIVSCNGEWGNVALERGLVVYQGTISSTGTQTSVDFAAAGTDGLKAYVFVTDITGSATDATIEIDSSANDSTFNLESTITFSAVGVATGTASGAVDRYIRIDCTDLGGATDFTVVVVVAVSGVTY